MSLTVSVRQRAALVAAADLKRRLVDFAMTAPYERHLRQQLRDLQSSSHSEEDRTVMAVEALLFEFEYDDGSSILDRFLARQQRLTPQERGLIDRWGDSVFGVFEIRDRLEDVLLIHNLLDELDYLALSTMGAESILPLTPASFLVTRLLPVEEVWLLSGIQVVLPPDARDEVAQAVREQALNQPSLVLRNPVKLAKAREMTEAFHDSFLDCFGTDRVVVPAHDAVAVYHRFLDHHEQRLAQPGHEWGSARGDALTGGWDAQFTGYATVAIWHRRDTGVWFLGDFQLVHDAFVDPSETPDPVSLDTLRNYLQDDTIPPWVIEELRAEFPEVADHTMALGLGKPDFDWQADGERLMRKQKPTFYQRYGGLPNTVPLPAFAQEIHE